MDGAGDPNQRSTTDRIQEAVKGAVGGSAGALIGVVVGGSEGAVVGATAGSTVQAGLGILLDRFQSWRSRNAERVLEGCAARAGITAEQLAEVTDLQRLLLAGEVIEAAMRTALEAKLSALADGLAAGIAAPDAARVDEEFLFVRALADIEEPHLQLLNTMVTRDTYGHSLTSRPEGAPLSSWTGRAIVDRHPPLERVWRALIATLERHALVEAVPVDNREPLAGTSSSRSLVSRSRPPHWRATELGEQFLDRLERGASAPLPGASGP